jgi:hypothetical protein
MADGSTLLSITKIPHLRVRPSVNNKLNQLPDDRKEQLRAWLKTLSYRKVSKLLLEEWGMTLTPNQLSTYYNRYVALEIIEERGRAMNLTRLLNKQIKQRPCDYAKAILDALGRRTIELSTEPETHPKILEMWVDMYKKLREQEFRDRSLKLKERRLDLIEKKIEEANKISQNPQLSEVEKAERMRQIFKILHDAPPDVHLQVKHKIPRVRRKNGKKNIYHSASFAA